MTNGLMGDGAVQAYHNEAMSQEMVYQTAGGSAETQTGGITMNLVPKDGGNQFKGGAKWARSPESWQGNNLTDDLKAKGVTGVDKIAHFEEFNVETRRPDRQEQAVVLRRVPPGLLRQADRQHLCDRRQPGVSAGVCGLRGFGQVRTGRVGREDGQPGRPPHLADV